MTPLSFDRYIGIDYSGAATPESGLKGLRVYQGDRRSLPEEVAPIPSPPKYWTRRGIARWLAERLSQGSATLVGIDHAFSFPRRYFDQHTLAYDWPEFLEDFREHWPTDEIGCTVQMMRNGLHGTAQCAPVIQNGAGSPIFAPEPSRSFTSMCPGRSQNPPMPACPGCGFFGGNWEKKCISGPSTAGPFPPGGPSSPRSIPPFGA